MKKVKKIAVWRVALAITLGAATVSLHSCMDVIGKASAQSKPKGVDFDIAIIPDPQYYVAETHGGKPEMLYAQFSWIKQHHIDSNIVFVAGMGDNVDNTKTGVPIDQQWSNVKDNGGYYSLETPAPGIPYGLAVGNHDEADTVYHVGDAQFHGVLGISPVRNTTWRFNKYFGVDHFKNKPWYGGHPDILGKNNNDCHYDKFTVAGQTYLMVFLPYDNENYEDKDGLMLKWALGVVRSNPKSKPIIISHGILKGALLPNGQNEMQAQGQRMYDTFKAEPNVSIFLCGHVNQGYHEETYNGHKIRIFMSDYQGQTNGGNGMMRTMKLNTANDEVSFHTFSPYLEKQ